MNQLKSLFIGIAFSIVIHVHSQNQFAVENLSVEGMKEMECVDLVSPRFSWQIRSDVNGEIQTAYQIIVASTLENINNNMGDMYNSGKVISSQNTFVPYDGTTLKSAATYYWKVKVWNKDGSKSTWSESSSWVTGLIYPDEKLATWIVNEDNTIRAPLFRKEISIDKPVKSALAFATGIGAYYLYTNGEKINDTYLDPGMTNYNSRILYQSYDLKQVLKKGQNVIGFLVGEGMGAFSINKEERFRNKNKAIGPYEQPMAWLQLVIEYEDESKDTILTDTSWKTTSSHIAYNNFYGGEDVDARKELINWNQQNFDDSDWKGSKVVMIQSNLQARKYPPMRIKETFQPEVIVNTEPGVYKYDFGQNIGGIWKLQLNGKPGTQLKIRGSERTMGSHFAPSLTSTTQIDLDYTHSGEYYFRDCISYFTLSGKPDELYEPTFFYSGFRYLQVETDDPNGIKSIKPEGSYVYSDLEIGGDFECSDTLLNEIHKITKYTMKGILKSAMLSNPHSEKFGWLGDSHLFSEAANYTFNMYPLYKNWLADMNTSQMAMGSGMIPSVNPPYRRKEAAGPTSPAWGATLPIYVLNTYRYYGDIKVVEDHYDNVKAWCNYLGMTDENYIVKDRWADHGNPGIAEDGEYINRGTSKEIIKLVGTAYYYRTAQIVSELAGILGRVTEEKEYFELSEKIKSSFNKEFLDKEKNIYFESLAPQGFCNVQTSNFLPLEFNLVPEANEMAVMQNTIEDINSHHNGNLFTGILGTRALMVSLLDRGYLQLLYDILHEVDYPGYKYWLDRGATTLLEFWNGESGDHMHGRSGTIDEFNFNYVLGIRSPNIGKTTPGFKHIYIEPWVEGPITWAKGYLETPQGKVAVDWKLNGKNLNIEVKIPVNADATLSLPVEYSKIYESGKQINNSNSNVTFSIKEKEVLLELKSGNYSFHFIKN